LKAQGVTAEDLDTAGFHEGLQSGYEDAPLAASIAMELAHSAFSQIGRKKSGKRRQPVRVTIPHYLTRFKSLYNRACGVRTAPPGRRLRRKSENRELVRKAKKALRRKTARSGSLRCPSWWVNGETHKLKLAGAKKNRKEWATERKRMGEAYRRKTREEKNSLKAQFAMREVAQDNEAEVEEVDDKRELQRTPFGMGSKVFRLLNVYWGAIVTLCSLATGAERNTSRPSFPPRGKTMRRAS